MPRHDGHMTRLHTRLIVHDADRALAFYERALGATIIERFRDDAIGKVVHAAIQIEDIVLSLADEDPEHGNPAPPTLGGTPVILSLTVEDADVWALRMVEAGAEILIPVDDRFYGKREGRVRDPFGHVWILSQPLETLSAEEIQRRVDRFHD